jgi:hypothetical protein
MARSHHRKKHRTQLRQFKHSQENSANPVNAKSRASSVFAIAGAILGLAVGYFATQGQILWIAVGLFGGMGIGYFIGRGIDTQRG